MSTINEIITQVKNILSADADITAFCQEKYGRNPFVKSGKFSIESVPLKEIPAVVVSDNYDERVKERFSFSEYESTILITCGVLQKDTNLADEEIAQFKGLVSAAVKKTPLLNGMADYSSIIKSKRVREIPHPLHFVELTMYVKWWNSQA